jgi:hypothetical protein
MECLIGKLPSIPTASRSFKCPTTLGTYGSLPKNGKGRFGFLSPLGVKESDPHLYSSSYIYYDFMEIYE